MTEPNHDRVTYQVPDYVLQFFLSTINQSIKEDPGLTLDFLMTLLDLPSEIESVAKVAKWFHTEFAELAQMYADSCTCPKCLAKRDRIAQLNQNLKL
jgi:hypothetical protein